MGFLTSFKKLFNKKIMFYLTWVYIYCFLVSLDFNIFTCSYLRLELSNIEDNSYPLFMFFFTFIIYSYNKSINYNKFKVKSYLIINYIILFKDNINFLIVFNTVFSNLIAWVNTILFNYNGSIFYSTILKIFYKLKTNTLLWFPIYKSYSIFGFYKSTRLKFVDLKNENLKRLKY